MTDGWVRCNRRLGDLLGGGLPGGWSGLTRWHSASRDCVACYLVVVVSWVRMRWRSEEHGFLSIRCCWVDEIFWKLMGG